MSKTDSQLLFTLRSKMLDVKTNFRHLYRNDLVCRTCKEIGSVENEDHILRCEMLKTDNIVGNVHFEFVFQDIVKQKAAVEAFKSVLRKREIILEYQD